MVYVDMVLIIKWSVKNYGVSQKMCWCYFRLTPVDNCEHRSRYANNSSERHIRQYAEEARYGRLSTISESGVFDILNKSNIKPFRIRYYCERRDPVRYKNA